MLLESSIIQRWIFSRILGCERKSDRPLIYNQASSVCIFEYLPQSHELLSQPKCRRLPVDDVLEKATRPFYMRVAAIAVSEASVPIACMNS